MIGETDLALVTVEELLTRRPETARVFFRHRMACVGCAMAPFDNLREAAANYHLPEEPFLDEIRQACETEDSR